MSTTGSGNDEAEEAVTTEQSMLSQTQRDRKAWIARVRGMSKNDLESRKVETILSLLKHIVTTFPNEKIVIFSKMLKFLDIVDEAIRRDDFLGQQNMSSPYRFDGTMDSNERQKAKRGFSNPDTRDIILITAGAGGAGMNLAAGSQIIQCEPWWTRTDEAQCCSRCYRFGQTKPVTVWVLHGINSVFDCLIEDIRDRKEELNHKIIEWLRRRDDEHVRIPRQYKAGATEDF